MGILGSKRIQSLERFGLFGRTPGGDSKRLEKAKRAVEADIDSVLAKMELPDADIWIDDDGWRHFTAGSADGIAGVTMEDDELFLQISSPIMDLPSDKELILPLMRDLLERNCGLPYPARYGITEGSVWVTSMRCVGEISREEVGWNLYQVMSLADETDDELKATYGGTAKKRSGQ